MDSLVQHIQTRRNKFMEEYRKKNYAEAAKVYASDCRYLEAGNDVAHGRDALAHALTGMAGAGFPVVKMVVQEVLRGADENLVERGYWQLFTPDGKIGERGMHVTLWKKVGDQHYAFVDCCNGSSE